MAAVPTFSAVALDDSHIPVAEAVAEVEAAAEAVAEAEEVVEAEAGGDDAAPDDDAATAATAVRFDASRFAPK